MGYFERRKRERQMAQGAEAGFCPECGVPQNEGHDYGCRHRRCECGTFLADETEDGVCRHCGRCPDCGALEGQIHETDCCYHGGQP